ncbi:hypothetical protein NKH77_56000 [Streptomyces sp. M19]
MTKDVLEELPELREAVEAVCEQAPSEARCRQIRAHARELVRALHHPDHPLDPGAPLADVFAIASLTTYERLALAGELRGRGRRGPPPRPRRTSAPVSWCCCNASSAWRSSTCARSACRSRSRSTSPGASGCAPASRPSPTSSAAAPAGPPRAACSPAATPLGADARDGLGRPRHRQPGRRAVRPAAGGPLPTLEEVRLVRRPQAARRDDPVSVEIYPLRRATRPRSRAGSWCAAC